MNPIDEAQEKGYSEDQILNFISKMYPHLNKKISQAASTGYSPKNILSFLSNFFPGDRPTRATSQQGVHAEKRQQDIEANKALMKQALTTGATLAGGALAGKALQKAAPAVNNILKGARGTPKPGPNAPGTPPIVPSSVIPSAEAPVASQAAEAIAPQIEKRLSQNLLKDLKQDFDRLKLTPKIEKLAARNEPEKLGAMLQKMVPDEAKNELEKKFGKSFSNLVEDYGSSFLGKAEKTPLSREGITQQFHQEYPKDQAELQPEVKIEKLAALPDGTVGKIVDERQGIASVELPDGKIRRKKLTEIEEEPPHLEKQITELLQAIPEEERSAVLGFASYNPGQEFEFEGKKHNIPFMGVQFHNGDFYMYPGVTKDQYDKVVSKAVKAKTTGENPWHAWTEGKESRGAGMYQLIKELEANFGKNFIKFKAGEGYDYFKRIRQVIKDLERRKKRKEP